MILVDGIRVKDIFKVSHLLKLSWLHWKRLYFKLKPVGNVKFFLGLNLLRVALFLVLSGCVKTQIIYGC